MCSSDPGEKKERGIAMYRGCKLSLTIKFLIMLVTKTVFSICTCMSESIFSLTDVAKESHCLQGCSRYFPLGLFE